jgi:serine protease AprX
MTRMPVVALVAVVAGALACLQPSTATRTAVSVIVQADDATTAAAHVRAVGGRVTHELDVIGAVGARVSPAQRQALLRRSGVRVYDDGSVALAGTTTVLGSAAAVPSVIDADRLHDVGVIGSGVTIAFVDSGYTTFDNLNRNARGQNRILAEYDAIRNVTNLWASDDESGHATHVMSAAASSYATDSSDLQVCPPSSNVRYHGVAPGADLVSVRAFDKNGAATYASVIRGINWVVRNAATYHIRVLNLSFAAPPRSYYWQDPLNQAVMAAWRAGIVVVASAGNAGPKPMTIGVPGNVPYVITVGAMSDHYTPETPGDDVLASFSSAGPTYEGFVKPELVAPGGHVMAAMPNLSTIALAHPEFFNGWYGSYFKMSGTSQAAGVVSGVAALVLSANPSLTPDQVKYRLMDAARPAVTSSGLLAYSIFEQGAGMVNAYDAAFGQTTARANRGLDINADLAGTAHYRGPANRDSQGRYYVSGTSDYVWNGSFLWSNGFLWSNSFLWSNGFLWSNATLWSDSFLWSNSWQPGYVWSASRTETAAINTWVSQE